MIETLFRLLVAHALCDFALQPEWIMDSKQRRKTIHYYRVPKWYICLSMHALICGGGVYWATGSLLLGIGETVLHWLLDFAKCESITNPNQDQLAHIGLRLFYWGLA